MFSDLRCALKASELFNRLRKRPKNRLDEIAIQFHGMGVFLAKMIFGLLRDHSFAQDAPGELWIRSDQTLQSIAAVVIGGVSLFGGRGSVLGVALGALFLATLANALNLINVTSYLQQIVIGCTIIVAVLLDIWQQEKRTKTKVVEK